MPWRRSATLQKPIPHSISSRLDDIKAEKCGPKLIILASSFYAYRGRRRTSSNPSGKVPSSLTKFSPEERTAYVMHPITDSSRTHGTRPDSGDSTPSAELSVRLLTPLLLNYVPSLFLSQPFFSSHKVLNTVLTPGSLRPHYVCKQYLGASYTEAKYSYFNGFLPITYAFFFHMCLLFTIICIDMT